MSGRTAVGRQRGFSMIELMIAILIGSLVLLGITSLFSTTSNVNRMENGLARLQENGRFALNQIVRDLRMATAMRSMRKASEGGGPGSSNPDRPIISYAALPATTGLPAAPTGAPTVGRYLVPPSYFLRGHDCIAAACTPALGGDGSDLYNIVGHGVLPALGVTAGSRARGADVLTMRYLRGEGVRLATSIPASNVNGAAIALAEPLAIGSSRRVVIGDYATTAIVSVAQSPGEYTSLTGGGNWAASRFSSGYSVENDVRINDFDNDFVNVTYYLRLESDPSRPGRLISNLRRRENGVDGAIAEGIERLDFLYHVEDRQGNTRPMSASQVQAMTSAQCPRASISPELVAPIAVWDAGNCGWRSVRAIEIFLLATTVDDVGAGEEPFQYGFLPNGTRNTANTTMIACDPAYATCPGGVMTVLPSNLGPGRMLRREFRTVVTIRNNAY